ncbi:hypothetical protein JNW88_13785 [Micromonospora sp. ATA32]|nr:hypothetical protein [Micromonospora sp. ATA32]
MLANCAPINDSIDDYYRENDCQGFTVGNVLGLVNLSPCGQSRDEVERSLLQQVARLQLERDRGHAFTLPFLPVGEEAPDNEEIGERLARHIGSDQAKHGFGKLSTDEVGVQIERLLDRFAAGEEGVDE